MIRWALQGLAAARDGEAGLTLAERARLAALRVPKRREDWLLGRVTAKAVAAAALGDGFPGAWRPGAVEIASEPSGMPYARLAPDAEPVARFAPGDRLPLSVSISHADAHALCAASCAAPGDHVPRCRVGVDLGAVEPRSRAFVETFFTEDERRYLAAAPPCERALRANLVWCAKEAVLKLLGLGLTVDTRALSCLPVPGRADPADWPIAPADPEWRPFVAWCGPALVPGGGTVGGIWRAFAGFVAALAARTAAGFTPALRAPSSEAARAPSEPAAP